MTTRKIQPFIFKKKYKKYKKNNKKSSLESLPNPIRIDVLKSRKIVSNKSKQHKNKNCIIYLTPQSSLHSLPKPIHIDVFKSKIISNKSKQHTNYIDLTNENGIKSQYKNKKKCRRKKMISNNESITYKDRHPLTRHNCYPLKSRTKLIVSQQNSKRGKKNKFHFGIIKETYIFKKSQ